VNTEIAEIGESEEMEESKDEILSASPLCTLSGLCNLCVHPIAMDCR
jgi:hypothetical protein